jgi:hypothetical protein
MPKTYFWRQEGKTLQIHNLANSLYAQTLSRSADGKTLSTEEGQRFRRAKTLACQDDPPASPAVQSCLDNPEDCGKNLYDTADETLETLCAGRLPFACLEILTRAEKAAKEAARASGDDTPNPVCRKGEAQYDEEACAHAMLQVMAQEFAAVLTDADPVPLPAATLARLPALCAETRSAEVCAKTAEYLWDAGRYSEAAQQFARACATPISDPTACQQARNLASLTAEALAPHHPDTLPCGRYIVQNGQALMSEFDFGDRGRIGTSYGDLMRGRLENGLVRIRHNRGGDFVLRPLADGRFVGLDRWLRYTLYQRDGGQENCAAPIVYQETQLKMDCRAGETMEACCARGGMQGCNAMGHMAALRGQWQAALPFYTRVCRAGIRPGCENMVQLFMEGGVMEAPKALADLCAENALHVACDVQELSGWEQTTSDAANEDEDEDEDETESGE